MTHPWTIVAEKGKEDCCWISFSMMGLVVFLVAAFYIFMYMTSENKKTNIKKTKNKETKNKETKNMGSKVKKTKNKENKNMETKITETNTKKTKKT